MGGARDWHAMCVCVFNKVCLEQVIQVDVPLLCRALWAHSDTTVGWPGGCQLLWEGNQTPGGGPGRGVVCGKSGLLRCASNIVEQL